MRKLLALAAIVLSLLVVGCTTTSQPLSRPVSASVPVPVDCVSGDRPATVRALRDAYGPDAWDALTVKQKTALVGAQGLAHQSYGQAIHAATGACQ